MDSSTLQSLGMMVLIFVAFYFLLIRPSQKKAKAQQALLASLTEGTRVMLGSGVFGTIKHLGERQAIIEVAPGFELTVARAAIARPVKPEEEDFEYADEDADDLVGDLPDTDPSSADDSQEPPAPAAR